MTRKSKSPAKSSKSIKYASKFVGELLDELIGTNLTEVKRNPKTVQKWLHKMKLSVLRKISIASKSLFKSKDVLDIQELQEKIEILKSNAEAKKISILQKIKETATLPSHITSSASDEVKERNDKIKQLMTNITDKLRSIHKKANELNHNIPTQIKPMNTTIEAIEKLLQQQKKLNKTSLTFQQDIHNALREDTNKNVTITNNTNKKNDPVSSMRSPLSALEAHLQNG